MPFYINYLSPIGPLFIREENKMITHLSFQPLSCAGDILSETPLLSEAKKQLDQYFAGRRKFFDLPLKPRGTDFQQKVWKELQKIKYGETVSYLEIAERVGNPKACRAVGMANHRNPIAIVIPCHRVVGKSGQLTGYAGGLHIKEFLLNLEKED